MMKVIGHLTILFLIWALPLVVGQVGSSLFVNEPFADSFFAGGKVHAQSNQAPKKKKKRTRRVPALREKVYKVLSEAQVMIDPESIPREEGDPPPKSRGTPQDAVELLQRTLGQKGINSYEAAQIWNILAFAYITLDDNRKAINAYEQILTQGAIPESLELNALRTLYQLHFSDENYDLSLEYIARWEELKGVPDPQVTYMKAVVYYYKGNMAEAMRQALLVEEIAIAKERKMREPWWRIQFTLYNEREDTNNAIRVLELLIHHYPKKSYWMNLGGYYSVKGWDDLALSTYHAAYTQGFLTKETELVSLSQRLLGADVPYEASLVLEKGFDEEIIEENEKHKKLLAQAYTMSQEINLAIDAWREAAQYSEDGGEAWYRLAQVLASEDRHKEAINAFVKARDLGELEDLAAVIFWQGASEVQLERWDAAIESFREAGRLDEEREEQVQTYIRYAKNGKKREEQLRAMREGIG